MFCVKLLSGFVVVTATILGMLALLSFAEGSKEAPSDSTHADTLIIDSNVTVDSVATVPQDTLVKNTKPHPRAYPFPSQRKMGANVIKTINAIEYTTGNIVVRSEADSIILAQNGFQIHGRYALPPPKEWPGSVRYWGEWPIEFDFNTIFDHVLYVSYPSKEVLNLNISANDSMNADTSKTVDSSKGAPKRGK